MPYRDKKMYKNPRLPKAAEIQSTPGSARDRKEPMAPQRGGKGMLQMAAQARARQPKEGTPPIPTAAAPTTPAPTRAPGAEADPRALAAQRMANQGLGSQAMGGGGGQQPPQDPTDTGPQYKLGTELETQGPAEPITYEKPDIGPVDTGLGPMKVLSGAEPFAGDEGAEAGEGPQDTEAPDQGYTPPVPPKEKPKEATGYTIKGKPVYGWVTKTGSGGDVFKSWGIVGYEEDTVVPGEEPQETGGTEATGYKTKGDPVYDSTTGEIIGYEEGTDVPLAGQEEAVAPDDAVEPAERNKYERMEKFFMDYLEQATGIPPEELQGQIAGLEAAGFDQMAKFAQQMAARGMSMSGVTGQGMGQIMTQTMLGIANLKFENAKLAVEERMNKIKNFMAFYGNMMSEENKKKHLDELERLERDKFDYDKEQNALSDKWVAVKNILALTGSEKWDLDALGWAFRAIDAGVDPALVAEWISSDGENVSLKPDAPDYPGMKEGEYGPPPEGATGGAAGFGEGSAAPKNAYPDFITDEQYDQFITYGQPPTEFGWSDDANLGWGSATEWGNLSQSDRHTAMTIMRGVKLGWPDPPPGWKDANPDKIWGESNKRAEWFSYMNNKKPEGSGWAIWGRATGQKNPMGKVLQGIGQTGAGDPNAPGAAGYEPPDFGGLPGGF